MAVTSLISYDFQTILNAVIADLQGQSEWANVDVTDPYFQMIANTMANYTSITVNAFNKMFLDYFPNLSSSNRILYDFSNFIGMAISGARSATGTVKFYSVAGESQAIIIPDGTEVSDSTGIIFSTVGLAQSADKQLQDNDFVQVNAIDFDVSVDPTTGTILSINIDSALFPSGKGNNYTQGNTNLFFYDGTVSQAHITAHINSSNINYLTVDYAGLGYTTAPTITVNAWDSSGNSVPATAVTATIDGNGSIVGSTLACTTSSGTVAGAIVYVTNSSGADIVPIISNGSFSNQSSNYVINSGGVGYGTYTTGYNGVQAPASSSAQPYVYLNYFKEQIPTFPVKKGTAIMHLQSGHGAVLNNPTVELVGGAITAVSISTGGHGTTRIGAGDMYYSKPSISVTGIGNGASLEAVVVGKLQDIYVTNGGSGFTFIGSPTQQVSVVVGNGDGGINGAATCPTPVANAIPIGDITLHSGGALSNAGTGYTNAPEITILSSNGFGSGATATATVDGSGHIATIIITAGGSGYTATPTIRISGGAKAVALGSGSISSIILNTLNVTGKSWTMPTNYSVKITSTSHGLSAGQTINITVSSDTAALPLSTYVIASVTTNDFTIPINYVGFTIGTASYTVPAGGFGYSISNPPTVSITGGGHGTGAQATASIANGSVSKITIAPGGTGTGYSYFAPPTVVLTGGGGTGAVAEVDSVYYTGSIQHVRIVNPGTGYTSAPTVSFYCGVDATATATVDGTGKISAINITNAGTGYAFAPSITISGSGGAVASPLINASITKIKVVQTGYNYRTAPTITVSGYSGTGVVAGSVISYSLAGVAILNAGTGYNSSTTATVLPSEKIITDDGNGNFTDPYISSGTIDYTTGIVEVLLNEGYFISDYYINYTSNAVSVPVVQGTYKEQFYAGNGSVNQKYYILNEILDSSNITVSVDEGAGYVTWSNVSNFLFSVATDLVYTQRVVKNGIVFGFGDNLFGHAPNGKIKIRYLITKGSAGDIGVTGTVNKIIDTLYLADGTKTVNTPSVISSTTMSGGYDGDTVSQIQRSITKYFSSNPYLVTKENYRDKLLTSSIVLDAKIYSGLEIYPTDNTKWTTVYAYVLPTIGKYLTADQETELYTLVKSNDMFFVDFKFNDLNYIGVNVEADVKFTNPYVSQTTINGVRESTYTIITNYFDPAYQISIGNSAFRNIYGSELIESISGISGVSRVNLYLTTVEDIDTIVSVTDSHSKTLGYTSLHDTEVYIYFDNIKICTLNLNPATGDYYVAAIESDFSTYNITASIDTTYYTLTFGYHGIGTQYLNKEIYLRSDASNNYDLITTNQNILFSLDSKTFGVL